MSNITKFTIYKVKRFDALVKILMGIERVKQVLLVLSGKGGVGKSSIAAQLALSLSLAGKKVGILDTDICGPSIPRIFNSINSKVIANENGQWVPVQNEAHRVVLFSMGFLMPEGNLDAAIIWRGPKKTAMISQMLNKVEWGDLDYLIVDTPPGTSDEHLALVTELFSTSERKATCKVVIVTTPQLVALSDVEREISFCKNVDLTILGVIENMSGWTCSRCEHQVNLFSSGGGAQLAEKYKLPLLGSLPIESELARLFDKGVASLEEYRSCKSCLLMRQVIEQIP